MYRRSKRKNGAAAILLLGLITGVLTGFLLAPNGNTAHPGVKKERLWLVPEGYSAERAEDEEYEPAEFTLPSSGLTVSVRGEAKRMELEDYLFGVVAGEMSAGSEIEALKAQAVAARTFTALHMAGGAMCKSGCTVCDDPCCCQAYLTKEELKAAWGSKYDEYSARIRRAVNETESVAVVYEGRLISALYHAASGSATESSEEVFAMALPYLVSVESPEKGEETICVQRFSAAELEERLNSAFPQARLSSPLAVDSLSVLSRTESGRVQRVKVGETEVSGCMLRSALGLRSTAFTLVQDGDGAVFTCTGYGHGVGMSQLGANEMAKEGADFKRILAHYYTGTELVKLDFGQ